MRVKERKLVLMLAFLLLAAVATPGGSLPVDSGAPAVLASAAGHDNAPAPRAADRDRHLETADEGAGPESTEPWYREPHFLVVALLASALIALLIAYIIHRHLELEKLVARRTLELEQANASLFEEHRAMESMLNDKSFLWEIASKVNSLNSTFDEMVDILGVLNRKMRIGSFIIMEISRQARGMFSSIVMVSPQGVEDITGDCGVFPDAIIEKLNTEKCFVCSETRELGYGEKDFFGRCGIRSVCIFPGMNLHLGVTGLICFVKPAGNPWRSDEVELLEAVNGILINSWGNYKEFHGRIAAEKKHTEAVKLAEKSVRMASIGIIAAGITHEINQPLNTLNIITENVLRNLERDRTIPEEEYRSTFESIYGQISRIEEIITHMRELWDSPLQKEHGLFDLNEAALHALSLIEVQIRSHGIELETALSGELLQVMGNRIHLEQIVINLVVNSMKALDETDEKDKLVRIATRSSDGWAVLEIEDNGEGIPDELRDNIFEPLFSTRRPSQGMGLGLAIVKRFVDEMGGGIEVGRSTGGGARFAISFPPVSSWDQQDGNSAG